MALMRKRGKVKIMSLKINFKLGFNSLQKAIMIQTTINTATVISTIKTELAQWVQLFNAWEVAAFWEVIEMLICLKVEIAK